MIMDWVIRSFSSGSLILFWCSVFCMFVGVKRERARPLGSTFRFGWFVAFGVCLALSLVSFVVVQLMLIG